MNDDARLVFSRAEYEDRLRAVRREMAARRLDVVIVDETEHLAYLAGWHASGSRYHCCLVPLDGDPVMVFRRLDEPAFLEGSWLREYVCFSDSKDPVEAVVRAINARGWATARLGIETDSHYLTVQTYEALRHALPRATLGDFATVLRDQRLRKSPREIEYLRHYYGATHPPRTSDLTRAFVPTAEWVLEPSVVFHMYTGAPGHVLQRDGCSSRRAAPSASRGWSGVSSLGRRRLAHVASRRSSQSRRR